MAMRTGNLVDPPPPKMPPVVVSWASARRPPVQRSNDSRKGSPMTTPPARSTSRLLIPLFFILSSSPPGRRVAPIAEGIAPGDLRQPRVGAVPVLLGRGHDRVDGAGVSGQDPPAQGVRQHVLSNTTDERVLLFHQDVLELAGFENFSP